VNLELWMREFIDGRSPRLLPVEPAKVPAYAEI
jgi:hypothetical protein